MLLELGRNHLESCQYDLAMSMFDAASDAVSCPLESSSASLSQQIQWESQDAFSKAESVIRKPAVDTYLEHACDVGPRQLRSAPLTNESNSIEFLQLTVCYNKALIYHAKNEVSQAADLYQIILGAFAQTVQPRPQNDDLLHLLMCVYNNLGHISYAQKAKDMALQHFQSAFAFGKRMRNPSAAQSLEIADALSNLCRCKYMEADVCSAVYEALEEILRVRLAFLDEDHPDVASAHFNLGIAEYLRKNNIKAMSHLMQYLKIATLHTNSAVDPLPGLIYVLLIHNDGNEDKMSRDLVCGLRSLQDKRHEVGHEHTGVASILNFIGTILFHQQELEHALFFFQEELRLEKGAPASNDDIGVSVTCNNIGRIMQELGRFPQAIQYYQQALRGRFENQIISEQNGEVEITKRVPTSTCSFSEPPATMNLFSTVWYNLGLIHDKMEAYPKAIKAFQMSLNLRRAMLGPDHADVACLVYNIGVLQMEQEMLNEATDSFREALRIRMVASAGQLNDRHVVKTLHKLSYLHRSKGNISGALEASMEILHILKRSDEFDLTPRIKNMRITLRDISELHHAQGELDMALKVACEAVQLLRNFRVSPDSASFGLSSCIEQECSALLLVGSLYHELCEPEKAKLFFSKAADLIQHKGAAVSSALMPLLEVSIILGSNHCAPEA